MRRKSVLLCVGAGSFAAGTVLRSLGLDAQAAIPDLILALGSTDANLRANAASALGLAAALPEAKAIVPYLIAAMRDSEPRVRMAAAACLGAMESRALNAKSTVIAALHDKDPWVAASAAAALGNLGTNATGAVPALITLIRSNPSTGGSAPAQDLRRKLILGALPHIDPEAAKSGERQ